MEGYIHRLRQTLPAREEPFDEPVGQVARFSLHAGVAAKAHQRQKLERLCRYISRPAVSEKRLSLIHGVFAPNSRDRASVTPAKRGRSGKPKAFEEGQEKTRRNIGQR